MTAGRLLSTPQRDRPPVHAQQDLWAIGLNFIGDEDGKL